MIDSKNKFRVDHVPKLLSPENEALRFFVRRDLLNEETGPIKSLWELAETEKILIKQQPDGSWKYPSSQYAPHYTAGLPELLVKAGYVDDTRIEKCYAWFHATRQEDGG